MSKMSWAQIPQEARASADHTAKHLPAFDPGMASSKSGYPESNQGQSDLCKLYSQMLYQLSYSRLDTLAHFCVCHPCGAMEIFKESPSS